MPDLERRAVTRFGLSLSEFWDSTPREVELLMERSAFRSESEMNQVRHIMMSIGNSVPRKSKVALKPKDIMYLPLIDGKSSLSIEDLKSEQQKAEDALKRIKERDNKIKSTKDGSN